jgi:hypothetical protein
MNKKEDFLFENLVFLVVKPLHHKAHKGGTKFTKKITAQNFH